MKLTPKQEKMLRDYCGNNSQRMEFIIEVAQEKGITIEQQIEEFKRANEIDLEMTGDILMD